MMNLSLWNNDRTSPRSLIEEMFGALDTYDDRRFAGEKSFLAVACDISENDEQYLLNFDLPGLKKEEVEIELNGRLLTVSGERKREKETKQTNLYRVERSFGKFRRSFELPDSVNTERIEAAFENGVLKISVPKAEAAKARKIEIGTEDKSFFQRLTNKSEAKAANS